MTSHAGTELLCSGGCPTLSKIVRRI